MSFQHKKVDYERYFVFKIVLTFCEEKLFQCIQISISKVFFDHQNNFLSQKIRTIFETECFLTCSWRFLRSTTLEESEFKMGKNNWDLETYRKSQKKTRIGESHFFIDFFLFLRPDYSILLWLSKGTFANWTNLLRIKPKLSCKKKKIKSELSPIVPQKISAQSSRISLRYRPRTSLELLSLGDHLTTRYVHFI